MKGPTLPVLPTAGGNPCFDHGCSQCCHDIEMLLTESDVRRIQDEMATRTNAPKDWFFQADDGYLQLRTRDGPPASGTPGGKPCVFLAEDGQCSIWDVRPEGCRLYPAMWDDSIRHAALDEDYCPHTDEFALPKSMDDATRRLASRLEQERAGRQVR